jgi:hypothetical protein
METAVHPVYVEGKGWIWAENLALGDRLRRADGGMARVLAIERIQLDEPQAVYNFTVTGPHTYFVLDSEILVHNCNPRRPGLEIRSDGGWKKGQLTDAEFEFFQRLARERGKKIVLSGSLTETDLGLARRYDKDLQRFLPAWRQEKPYSSLVSDGIVRDIDIAQISALTPTEIARIQKRFPKAEIDVAGYSKFHYPNETSFNIQGGAIVFYPSGRTVRRAAPWQKAIWQTTADPRNIYLTQNTIGARHRGGYTVEGNIQSLRSGSLQPKNVGAPIRVFVKTPEMDNWGSLTRKIGGREITGDPRNLLDGRTYSLDNRRLHEFQQAGITEIPIEVVTDMDFIKSQRWKFTTEDFGETVTIISRHR